MMYLCTGRFLQGLAGYSKERDLTYQLPAGASGAGVALVILLTTNLMGVISSVYKPYVQVDGVTIGAFIVAFLTLGLFLFSVVNKSLPVHEEPMLSNRSFTEDVIIPRFTVVDRRQTLNQILLDSGEKQRVNDSFTSSHSGGYHQEDTDSQEFSWRQISVMVSKEEERALLKQPGNRGGVFITLMVMVAHVYAMAVSETVLAPLAQAGPSTVTAFFTGFGVAALAAHTLMKKCQRSQVDLPRSQKLSDRSWVLLSLVSGLAGSLTLIGSHIACVTIGFTLLTIGFTLGLNSSMALLTQSYASTI